MAPAKKAKAKAQPKAPPIPVTPATTAADPLAVNSRLYRQIALLLDALEEENPDDPLDIKQRIAALIAVGRIQTMFVGLRKESVNVPRGAGSAVRKYSTAFKNDARRGATRARSTVDDAGTDDSFGDADDDTAA